MSFALLNQPRTIETESRRRRLIPMLAEARAQVDLQVTVFLAARFGVHRSTMAGDRRALIADRIIRPSDWPLSKPVDSGRTRVRKVVIEAAKRGEALTTREIAARSGVGADRVGIYRTWLIRSGFVPESAWIVRPKGEGFSCGIETWDEMRERILDLIDEAVRQKETSPTLHLARQLNITEHQILNHRRRMIRENIIIENDWPVRWRAGFNPIIGAPNASPIADQSFPIETREEIARLARNVRRDALAAMRGSAPAPVESKPSTVLAELDLTRSRMLAGKVVR